MKRLLFTILLVMGIGALSAQDSINITFHVNMNQFTVDPGGVYVAGGAGFGVPGDNELTDPDGDGVYTGTVRRPENFSSFYTFLNGNCGDWSCKEQIGGQPCSDPANFNDRFFPVTYNDTVIWTCFQECSDDTVCTPVGGPVNVTFRVDMNNAPTTPDSMFLGANFASWNGTAIPMDDSDGDGIWEVVQMLSPGGIEYKFISNQDWEDLNGIDGEVCVQNFGGFVNRIANISGNGDTVFCVAPWEQCCAEQQLYDVIFSVDVSSMSPAPMAVNIGANWDGWSGGIAMHDAGNGIWVDTITLSPGPIEYKFITDGNWEALDSLDGQPCVYAFGAMGEFVNRVDTVTGDVTLCTPVIGQCCAATSIDDILVDNNLFVLRPTLASDFAYIDFPELRGETAQLQVLNSMGQVVLNKDVQTNGTHRLDVRNYAAGLYFVQVKVGNTIGTKKMIVD